MGGGTSTGRPQADLVKQLSSPNARKQSDAMEQVLALTSEETRGLKKSGSARALLVAAGAIDPLVAILKTSTDVVQLGNATLALSKLATEAYVHRVAIANGGGVPALLKIVRDAEALGASGPGVRERLHSTSSGGGEGFFMTPESEATGGGAGGGSGAVSGSVPSSSATRPLAEVERATVVETAAIKVLAHIATDNRPVAAEVAADRAVCARLRVHALDVGTSARGPLAARLLALALREVMPEDGETAVSTLVGIVKNTRLDGEVRGDAVNALGDLFEAAPDADASSAASVVLEAASELARLVSNPLASASASSLLGLASSAGDDARQIVVDTGIIKELAGALACGSVTGDAESAAVQLLVALSADGASRREMIVNHTLPPLVDWILTLAAVMSVSVAESDVNAAMDETTALHASEKLLHALVVDGALPLSDDDIRSLTRVVPKTSVRVRPLVVTRLVQLASDPSIGTVVASSCKEVYLATQVSELLDPVIAGVRVGREFAISAATDLLEAARTTDYYVPLVTVVCAVLHVSVEVAMAASAWATALTVVESSAAVRGEPAVQDALRQLADIGPSDIRERARAAMSS